MFNNNCNTRISMEFMKIPSFKCEVRSIIQFLLKNLKWYEFAQPVHFPNLAASNFHLFPWIKIDLGGKQFSTRDKFITEVSAIVWN